MRKKSRYKTITICLSGFRHVVGIPVNSISSDHAKKYRDYKKEEILQDCYNNPAKYLADNNGKGSI